MPIASIKKATFKNSQYALLLRPITESDAEMIHEAVLSSKDNLLHFMDWIHRDQSVEQQRKRIRHSIDCASKRLSYDFILVHNESQEFLMSASLHASRVPNNTSLGIGYWTASKYCNRGLATVVTKMLTTIAIEQGGCDRVEIGCNKANLTSQRVIEKCGFILECEAKNYFSKPSFESVQNGFTSERTGLLYALTNNEAKKLTWYDPIINNLHIT